MWIKNGGILINLDKIDFIGTEKIPYGEGKTKWTVYTVKAYNNGRSLSLKRFDEKDRDNKAEAQKFIKMIADAMRSDCKVFEAVDDD